MNVKYNVLNIKIYNYLNNSINTLNIKLKMAVVGGKSLSSLLKHSFI